MIEDVGLVADIGRHAVRFGLTGGRAGLIPHAVQRFKAADHTTFTSALVEYLNGQGLQNVAMPSVLAIAGAARGDLINVTGSRWYISLDGLQSVLRVRPRALNECAANALALSTLGGRDFMPLPGPAMRAIAPGGNYVVIGCGTGLGVSALVSNGERLVPVQSEAGHIAFTPATENEHVFARYCQARGKQLEMEALLGANGRLMAYEALSGGRKLATPEDVTRNLRSDPICAAVVSMYVSRLGAFAGDLALAFGGWDGLYLTGAIAQALHPSIATSEFRQAFEAKAAFRRQLSAVPAAVVSRNDLELVGAAVAFGNA